MDAWHAGVSECMLTGGIPPEINSPCAADAVYQRTYHHVIKQNQKFYERFPQDVDKVKKIVRSVRASVPTSVPRPRGFPECNFFARI